MGKNQSASGLTNIVQYDNNGNISFVSGSTTLMQISSSGQITTTGVISGSNALSSSYALNSGLLNETGSVGFATTGSLLTVSSSQQQISASQQQISSSLLALTASYNALSSSYTALSASYNTASSSFSTRITSDSSSLSSRTTQIENVYATTGSNTFTGTQNFSNTCTPNSFTAGASIYTAGGLRVTQDAYFSSSVYIKGNVTVFGTQSVSYISSSQLDIGTNIITVNTSTPSVRYGGLSVFDSGSTGLTGSIFWDSELNRWIYVNASGSGGGATYGGGMFISGPRNSVGLGCEQGTTACMLLAGQGGDHLTSSMIYHSSTVTCVPNTLIGSTICTTMANASCIGIGTTTPTHPLEIYAATGNQLKISTNDATSANNSGIFFYNEASATSSTRRSYILLDPNGANGSGGDYSYFDMYGSGTTRLMNQLASGLLALGVGGTNIINITGSSVGIGTSSPGAKLEVAGVDENILKLKNTSGQPALVRFNDTSTTGDPYIGSYGNSLAFGIYGVGESIRINSSRNVGIRTDAPFSLLHVGTRPGAGTTNPSLCSIATISNDGLTGIDLGGNVNANNVVGHINWVNYLGVGNYNTARIDVYANGAGNSGDLRFWTATVASSPTIRLTISSTGAATFCSSVSIGGADQGYQLDVKRTSTGDATFDTVANFYKASTHNTGLLLRLKNTIVDLAANNITGGGGPTAGMSFSVSSGGTICTALTLASTGAACFACCITAPALKINSPTYIPLVINSSYGQVGLEFQLGGTGFGGIGSATNFTGAYTNSSTDLGLGTNGSATSNIIFATGAGSTRRIVITAAGNVGIGATAPSSLLHICGAGTGAMLRLQNTTTVSGDQGPRIQFMSANQVGNQDFETGYIQSIWQAEGNAFSMRFATKGVDASQSEKMRIFYGGQVAINRTDSGAGALGVRGLGSTDAANAFYVDNSNTSELFSVRNDGVIRTGTIAGSPYNNTSAQVPNLYVSSGGTLERGTSSSMRYKENIIDWEGSGINTILALKPKTFKYKKDYYHKADIDFLGLIAEEVAEVSPYLADYENEDRTGQVENVRYANIVTPLIKAVQEQQCTICSQAAMINTLKTCLGIA